MTAPVLPAMTSMTSSMLDAIFEPALVAKPRWWVGARAAIANAKSWQAVLVDWSNGAPLVLGEPASRHWTRFSARRASDWANLRTLPVGVGGGHLRYMAMPTRHPTAS